MTESIKGQFPCKISFFADCQIITLFFMGILPYRKISLFLSEEKATKKKLAPWFILYFMLQFQNKPICPGPFSLLSLTGMICPLRTFFCTSHSLPMAHGTRMVKVWYVFFVSFTMLVSTRKMHDFFSLDGPGEKKQKRKAFWIHWGDFIYLHC